MSNHTIPPKVENGGGSPAGRLTAAETNTLLDLGNAVPLPITGMTMAQLQAANLRLLAGQHAIASDTGQIFIGNGTARINTIKPLRGVGLASPSIVPPKAEPVFAHDFGALGNDNEANLVDDSAALLAGLSYACANGRPFQIQATNYRLDSALILNQGLSKGVEIVGVGGVARFIASENLGETTKKLIEIESPSLGGGWVVTQNLEPGDKVIELNTVSGLAPGQMFNLRSNAPWPYDGRGEWEKGETHIISSVNASTRRITVQGLIRDRYTVATDAPSLNVGNLVDVLLANLHMEFSTGVTGQILVNMLRCRPTIENVSVKRAGLHGVKIQRSLGVRISGLHAENIGNALDAEDGNVGYGLSLSSTVDMHIAGLRTHACRRAIDFGGTPTAGPCRDALVTDFYINGGGMPAFGAEPFEPEGATKSYAVGMHGPCDNAKFYDGTIVGVGSGVTVRGLDTTIERVEFIGVTGECIYATYGEGLVVKDCRALTMQGSAPLKEVSPKGPRAFIWFNRGGTGPARWKIGRATVITNNLFYMTEAFIMFDNQGPVANFFCKHNEIVVNNQPASPAYVYGALGGGAEILNGEVGPNTVQRQYNAGTFFLNHENVRFGVSEGLDNVVAFGDGQYRFTVGDDATKILRLGSLGIPSGVPVGVKLTSSSASIMADLVISTTGVNTPRGLIGADVLTANTSLSGTTGPEDKLTISLTASGLIVQNRMGGARALNIEVR